MKALSRDVGDLSTFTYLPVIFYILSCRLAAAHVAMHLFHCRLRQPNLLMRLMYESTECLLYSSITVVYVE